MVAEYQRLIEVNQFGVRPQISLLETCKKTTKTVSGSTKTSYQLSMRKLCGLDKFAGPGIWGLKPDLPISELRTHQIAELKSERAEEGLKANSINIEIRYVQRVYNLCREEWDYDVFAGVKFKMLKGFQKSHYLSYEEEEQVLDLLKQPSIVKNKAANLMIFLLDTGVRLQEALNVTWQDINFSSKSIEVYRG